MSLKIQTKGLDLTLANVNLSCACKKNNSSTSLLTTLLDDIEKK